MKDLRGKAVLITGAASGIGRATALEFARAGAGPMLLCDVDEGGLEETAAMVRGLGGEAVSLPADVSDYGAVRAMFETAMEAAGRIDLLVNVAGIGIVGPMEVLEIEDWMKVMGVDLCGVLHTVNLAYPHMLARGSGHIVNVSSGAGLLVPTPYNAPYNTSKFAVVGLSESLLYEARAHGIGVTCVCPGLVRTPIYETSRLKGLADGMKRELDGLMVTAEGPEDTARAIVDAVRKDRFLVVTTFFFKSLYFARRHLPFVWFPLMRFLSRLLVRHLERFRIPA
ncbi:MAG: SDR family NAD(P)-dependent oxidoreductase [Actinomycetota bacterium]